MSDDVPTLGQRHRVRVFVDFWNYSLSMRDVDENFRTDWSKLGPVLSNAVDNYDVAVLVSSDRDFVPVAEFLETRGIKVIHGAFPPKGAQLTRKCWGSINIADLREGFRFVR